VNQWPNTREWPWECLQGVASVGDINLKRRQGIGAQGYGA
jgi:hypothetical protein